MLYPNNGLYSYVNLINDEYGLKPKRSLILKFLSVLPIIIWRTLKDAGIELMFLLVFWVIIMKMSQGRDLVVSLFEPDGLYGNIRVVFTTLAVLSFSLSMWIIPAFLFEQRETKSRGLPNPPQPFNDHLFFIHRILPLIPFWLLASALFNGNVLIFIIAAIAELILLYLFNHKVKNSEVRRNTMISIAAILIMLTIYFFSRFQEQYTEMKIILALNLYLLSALMFLIYHDADNRILTAHAAGKSGSKSLFAKYRGNSILYFACVLTHTIVILIIYYLPFNLNIAPESMLLYMFSVYVFAIDLIFYIVNVTQTRQVIAAIGFCLLLGLLVSPIWNVNVSHHTMDANGQSTFLNGANRDDFETRYLSLKEKITNNRSGQPYPIILVSGEGGGSRAGLWFSQNLINFDYETKAKFRNHIFSLSTVSGSSVGLSTVFSFWDKTRNLETIDSNWLKLPSELYANNYIGSSIRGLLLTDLYKSLIPGNWANDRNTTLQNEEAVTTARALLKIKGDQHYKDATIADSLMTLKKDLMYYFYEVKNGKVTYRDNTPITLINTCRSNDGRRGIFSSIRLSDSYFNDAIDVAGYLYEDSICTDDKIKQCNGIKKPISLGQACNTSELFPIFSSPAYIDSLGSFVDGGYHENSGLKSTLDIYQQLRHRLESDTLEGKYKIYIMYLKNGSGEKSLYKQMKSEITILQPLNALFNQPFAGSASYFEERAKFISVSDTNAFFINVDLKSSFIADPNRPGVKADLAKRELEKEILKDMTDRVITKEDGSQETILTFPLARWLSKTVINRILVNASPDNRKPDATKLLELVRAVNRVNMSSKLPFQKYPVVPALKIEEDTIYRKRMLHRAKSLHKTPGSIF